MKRGVVLLGLLAMLALPAIASATDAQVKAAVTQALSAATHQKGAGLTAAAAKARKALTAAAPTTAKGKSAKALALQAVVKESAAGAAQVKAEQANTKMQYPAATSQTAIATKDVETALALLHKAAALLAG